MLQWFLNSSDQIFHIIKEGGALSAGALLFLYSAVITYMFHSHLKADDAIALKRLDTWQAATIASEHTAAAIDKMADQLQRSTDAQNNTANQVAIAVELIKRT